MKKRLNTARKGRRFEHIIKNRLYDEGFDLVVRSAASKTPIDLIAFDIFNKKIRLVQCKHPSKKLTKSQRQTISDELRVYSGEYKIEYEIANN